MPALATLGVVLAGGQSRRMGRDKALLTLNNLTFAAHVAGALKAATGQAVLSVARHTEALAAHGFALVVDEPDLSCIGPCGGVLSALRWAEKAGKFERILTAPVDMPFLIEAALRHVAIGRGEKPVAVGARKGETIPTLGLWAISARPQIEQLVLREGVYGLKALQTQLGAVETCLDDFDPRWFLNINTPDEFAASIAV